MAVSLHAHAHHGALSPQVRHPRTLEAHRGLGARQPLVSFAQQARAVAGLEETADEVLALLQA